MTVRSRRTTDAITCRDSSRRRRSDPSSADKRVRLWYYQNGHYSHGFFPPSGAAPAEVSDLGRKQQGDSAYYENDPGLGPLRAAFLCNRSAMADAKSRRSLLEDFSSRELNAAAVNKIGPGMRAADHSWDPSLYQYVKSLGDGALMNWDTWFMPMW